MKAYGNISDMRSVFPVYAYRYVCLSGSSSPTPSDGSHGYLCPAGHSCPVGSASEVPCKPGTYSPAPGAAHCLICPNGTMCSSSATQEPSICPTGEDGENKPSLFRMNHIISRFSHTTVTLSVDGICFFVGHFCPAGTALPHPCPLGTFNNQTSAHSLSACTPCPSGVYCDSYGASIPQGTDTKISFWHF